MAVLAFIGSVAVTGIVASLVPVTTVTEQTTLTDYHYVPDMGDAFGA